MTGVQTCALPISDSQEALLHYASWLVRTGRTREASDTLRKIGAVPESESLAIMARALMADAEPLRSRAIALELCAAFPDNPQAMDSALGILFSAGHMEDYRRLRVANPNLLPALERAAFWYAVDAVREGDYHAALTALRSHVAEGDDYALWYDMALVQGAMGRARDAAESFSAAASRAMDNRRGADALTRKASMLRRAGLYSEAKDAYGAAIALDPACAAARTGLSSLEAGRP